MPVVPQAQTPTASQGLGCYKIYGVIFGTTLLRFADHTGRERLSYGRLKDQLVERETEEKPMGNVLEMQKTLASVT